MFEMFGTVTFYNLIFWGILSIIFKKFFHWLGWFVFVMSVVVIIGEALWIQDILKKGSSIGMAGLFSIFAFRGIFISLIICSITGYLVSFKDSDKFYFWRANVAAAILISILVYGFFIMKPFSRQVVHFSSPKSCNNIFVRLKALDNKNECFYRWSTYHNNPQGCNLINYPPGHYRESAKWKCLSTVAQRLNDESLCAAIPEGTIKGPSCHVHFAFINKQKKDEAKRQERIQRIKKRNEGRLKDM